MSLTYPVLNDILFEKISNVEESLDKLGIKLKNLSDASETYRDNIFERISSQNTKINLIHQLFKHYKTNISESKTSNIRQAELETLKTKQDFIVNSIKLEYDNILKNKLKQNQDILLKRITLLENTNNKLETALSSLESKVQVLIKSHNELIKSNTDYSNLNEKTGIMNKMNYRLNSLEKRYITLDTELNKYIKGQSIGNNKNKYSILGNDSSSESDRSEYDEGNTNWIKVTKKHKQTKEDIG